MSDVSAVHDHPIKATISMLPITDLNSNDMNRIYSTLDFIESPAGYLEIVTTVVTFDQPLRMKATEIMNGKSMGIVCILGGFHLLMSFLGSIGSLMKGSGLEVAPRVVFAENTVPYMITGKTISQELLEGTF